MEKLVFLSTQWYDITSGQVGKSFVSTFAEDLEGIWSVWFFQKVILQHVPLVTGARNIRDRIDDQIDLWNSGSFDELVCDYYYVAT